MPFDMEWHGDEVSQKMQRAAGRALVAIGENIVVNAKEIVHVITGSLRRSIHSAPANYNGAEDWDMARDSARGGMEEDIQNAREEDVTHEESRALIEVGSWLEYAATEEVGRGHKYLEPAVEAVRGQAEDIIAQAVREEGL